jgi:methyl-accepting chemotaxis protein
MKKWMAASLGNRALALVMVTGLLAVLIALAGGWALQFQQDQAGRVDEARERAMLGERLNGVIYRVVMESRGIYAAPTTEAAKPFAKGLKDGLAEALEVASTLDVRVDSEETHALLAKVREFIRFRTETARLGVEVSPQAANEQGNNEINRANRSALNKQVSSFLETARSDAKARAEANADVTRNLQLSFMAGSVTLAMILALVALVTVNRSIRRPLAETTVALRRVLAREQVVVPGVERKDEIGVIDRKSVV